MSLTSSIDLVALAVSVIAVIIAAVAILVPWYYQRKQYNLAALVQVHEMIGGRDARHDREEIYGANREFARTRNITVFNEHKDALFSVRGDLDIVGSMYAEGLIPREEFLAVYSGLVINMWKIQKQLIEAERSKKGENYMHFFDELAKEAVEYRRKRGEPEPIIY